MPIKAHTVAVATPCCPAPVSAIILVFHVIWLYRYPHQALFLSGILRNTFELPACPRPPDDK